jgi:hypothetical protein
MRTNKNITYSVAPLSKKDCNNIIKELRIIHPLYSGIPTFEICNKVKNYYKSDKNLCYLRNKKFIPCITLCRICINILYKISEQNTNENKKLKFKGLKY